MDPITLIVTALSAGVAAALQDDAKAAYVKLRDMLKKRFSGRKVGELALAEHEAEPAMWEPQLRAELTATGAADDADLVATAQALMKLVDEAGARSGKYNVTIHGGQGIQIGDHNTQTNTFGT
jgi:RIP homotypic interaction motif